jgi:hypothetical protein
MKISWVFQLGASSIIQEPGPIVENRFPTKIPVIEV